jgi:hypothetical protein
MVLGADDRAYSPWVHPLHFSGKGEQEGYL